MLAVCAVERSPVVAGLAARITNAAVGSVGLVPARTALSYAFVVGVQQPSRRTGKTVILLEARTGEASWKTGGTMGCVQLILGNWAVWLAGPVQSQEEAVGAYRALLS